MYDNGNMVGIFRIIFLKLWVALLLNNLLNQHKVEEFWDLMYKKWTL
jgi:hypothetical protein